MDNGDLIWSETLDSGGQGGGALGIEIPTNTLHSTNHDTSQSQLSIMIFHPIFMSSNNK